MGVACTIGGVLQRRCGAPVVVPGGVPVCDFAHADALHPMTWIVDEFPASWNPPFAIDWGDGTVETGTDGEDAHEYATAGTYVIAASDGMGHSCKVTVVVPPGT